MKPRYRWVPYFNLRLSKKPWEAELVINDQLWFYLKYEPLVECWELHVYVNDEPELIGYILARQLGGAASAAAPRICKYLNQHIMDADIQKPWERDTL